MANVTNNAPLKLIYIEPSGKIPTSAQAGALIVTHDGKTFKGQGEGQDLLPISDIIILDLDVDRLLLSAPITAKMYFVLETKLLWIYINNNWHLLTTKYSLNTDVDKIAIPGLFYFDKQTYAKVISVGSLPDAKTSNLKKVAHNVSNIGMIVKIEGFAKSSTLQEKDMLQLPSSAYDWIGSDLITIQADSTYIYIYVSTDKSMYDETYVVLYYIEKGN